MYLKSLELQGFKSFADRTKLVFEPGMAAIVGPNGCGKSNVSDAIRWVLGEQSAKALRGNKMEDCIFNGTDFRKPLGMAEVSITFSDCEEALGTDYHEVTISRRVFRSGEGQYLLNKTPCRLRDIQRLFMDTGIGTTSYSLMEQGRIDRVLSSRPEDRRAVFEEASGITKFKSDKKEALRKLEHTEANLLRLADVIREVKRQIGSLQRQAGKARRYKALREELRGIELYVTAKRSREMTGEIERLEQQLAELNQQLTALRRQIHEQEQQQQSLRAALSTTGQEIANTLEQSVHAESKLESTHEQIRVNRQRIAEYEDWSQKNSREIDHTQRQLDEAKTVHAELATRREQTAAEQQAAKERLDASNQRFQEHQQFMENVRHGLVKLREEALEIENLTTRLQNQLVELDSRETTTRVQRERLSAEKKQLTQATQTFTTQQTEMDAVLQELTQAVVAATQQYTDLTAKRKSQLETLQELQHVLNSRNSLAAAKTAQLELLQSREQQEDDFPAGARRVLEQDAGLDLPQAAVRGALAELLHARPGYEHAVEATLRPWMDAIVVQDVPTARTVLTKLLTQQAGTCRLLAGAPEGSGPELPPGTPGVPLLDHVEFQAEIAPLAQLLLGNIRVFEHMKDVPHDFPEAGIAVTREGALLGRQRGMELWMPEPGAANPLSRRHQIDETRQALESLAAEQETAKTRIQETQKAIAGLDLELEKVLATQDEAKNKLAQKQGEAQLVRKEGALAIDRLETVSFELDALLKDAESGVQERAQLASRREEQQTRREQINQRIAQETRELQQQEEQRANLQAEVTDQRVRYAELSQKYEHTNSQLDSIEKRMAELTAILSGRSADIEAYHRSIAQRTEAIKTAEAQLASLESQVKQTRETSEALHARKEQQTRQMQQLEHTLESLRTELETLHASHSALEVKLTEARMRRQNLLDRMTSEYSLTVEQLWEAPEPEWEGEIPAMDLLETQAAELRTKLEAMGPVNLVAIEEYKELEERFTFLSDQEEDLIKAKQQLMDMIRRINKQTSQMFSETFAAINENFQQMFVRLFNGGSAKLVLVNEEDILDCGIEIIARPPGKRLQNISLLSGGERTLTAVSLLFAIYMIKPSPFCLLDELDAALDETNIDRFVMVLKDFIQQSQFVVITHNRKTIAAANVLYGVTMPQKGVSKIVSMKFSGSKEDPVVATPQKAS